MANANCPTLGEFLLSDDCSENFGGMATTVYVFKRKDLASNGLAKASNKVATYKFASKPFIGGGRLWKFECKRESQNVQGSSQGFRKGFIITATFVIEAVNEDTAELARALNTGDLGFIFVDSDGKFQIIYDTDKRCEIDSDGLTTDTGTAASDDRQMSVSVKLGPVSCPNYFLDNTKAELEGWRTEATAATT